MKTVLKYGSIIIIMVFLVLIATSCAQFVDFRDKGIGFETKVLGLEASIPDVIMGGVGSMLTIRFGWISTKYASAPAGTEVRIDDQYKDISFWTLSGTVTSLITISNKQSQYPSDAPLKGKE